LRSDELVMAIAGMGRGADTAVVLRPTNAQTFFDLGIVDIVCRPRCTIRHGQKAKSFPLWPE